jgi:hypothetical protein
MTTTTIEQLEKHIEHMIRAHIAECRRRAAAAVERGFASSRARPKVTHGAPRQAGRRRTPDEISKLGERLYQAVCAHPGSTMATLAPIVGAASPDLSRPVEFLKRAGRVRSAGQRHMTRYFPMTERGTAKSAR